VRWTLLPLLFLAGPAAAQVEVVSPRPDSVAVVAYRDRSGATSELYGADDQPFSPYDTSGLALVAETRVVNVPAGRSRIRFRDVSEGMLPQSAALEGLPGGVERNYDFDLLTPGSLIQRAVGERVRRVRTNPETGAVTQEPAVIRSGPNGVVLDIAGRIEALGCSGGPERLVFDRVPPGLADTPTLSVLVDSPAAGRRTLKLSYLTFGVRWAADYVARVRPDGRTLDLLGWITLSNRTRTTFLQTPLQVVAGNLNREQAERPQAEPPVRTPNCWPMDTTTDVPSDLAADIVVTGGRVMMEMAPPPPPPPAMAPAPPALIAEQSDLGDYKLYTLPEPVTVAARQTKQVAFLDQRGAPFRRVYVYRVGPTVEQAQSATVSYRLENTAAGGLGRPLPTGTVSVIAPGSDGRLLLVGQARTTDLPVGSPVRLEVGRSFDVTVRPRFDQREAERGRWVVEAEVANAGSTPAEVEVIQPVGGQAFRVQAEDRPHEIRDGAPVWRLTVPANGRATVRYTVTTGTS
jgi:hypothetical protein